MFKVNYIENNKYDSTDMLYSLYLGLKKLNDDVIILFRHNFF